MFVETFKSKPTKMMLIQQTMMSIQSRNHHQAVKQTSPVQMFPMNQVTQMKKKKVIGLLENIGNKRNKVATWKSTLPIRDHLEKNFTKEKPLVRACQRWIENREPKDSKNAIMEELVGKKPHGTFEVYVNEELKEMIVTKTNRYVAQKNKFYFYSKDLETFIAVLIALTGYHSLPRTRMFWEKEEAIGLSIVYASVKEFEDIKRYINFADNN